MGISQTQGCPAHGLQVTGHMRCRLAMNAAQHKIVNLLKTLSFAHQFSLVFMYLVYGPRQLVFFQCGPEMPKGRTPLCQSQEETQERPRPNHGSQVYKASGE